MNCPNCNSKLWQEHTKMWSKQGKDIDTNHAYIVIDNWHCLKQKGGCGSVFTNKELNTKVCVA